MDQSIEQWRPVVGYEGYYEVSDHGRVRSVDRVIMSGCGTGQKVPHRRKGRIMHGTSDAKGYRKVRLRREGQAEVVFVHRLVMQTFKGAPPPEKPFVNHKNGITSDNSLKNLEWCNNQENQWHALAQPKYLYKGESIGVSEMSVATGINRGTLRDRLSTMSTDEATTKPLRRNNEKYEYLGCLRSIPEIAALSGISLRTLYRRLNEYGMSLAEALAS